jgi:RHS repeat-associated protein
LPVSSMTAGVTVFGEPTDADAISIARREYDPFGLELTSDDLARTKREEVTPMSVFHGKELDRVKNFSSFGARYYSRDIGIWLKPDPMLGELMTSGPQQEASLSSYSFAANRPTSASDQDGNDAIVVVFPDYRIAVEGAHVPLLGHAGAVLFDRQTGATRYYEYGRYQEKKYPGHGFVRSVRVPNLVMEKGKPTEASMEALMRTLSAKSGEHGRVMGEYDPKATNYSAMVAFAEGELRKHPQGDEYGLLGHNCYSFAAACAAKGHKASSGSWSLGDLVPNLAHLVGGHIADVPNLKEGHDIVFDPKRSQLGGSMYEDKP